jgi:regulator of replication initiation timing
MEDINEMVDELTRNMECLVAENAALTKIIAADASLHAAVQEVKRLTAENDALRERNAALMTEKNVAIRAAKKKKVVA